MTDPARTGDVPDADRAEQEALLDPPGVAVAAEAAAPGDGVPEADALEQQLDARPVDGGTPAPVGDREASEADVLEQQADVPVDDDEAIG